MEGGRMEESMQKQKKQFIVVFVVLLLCVAGYVALTQYNKAQEKKEQEKEAAETITLTDWKTKDITAFSYPLEGKTLSFTKDADGNWTYDEDTSIPLDQDKIDTLLENITNLTAAEMLDNPEDLSEYGITDESSTMTFTREDGTTTFTLGAQNEINSQYYLQMSGDEHVYLIEESLETIFSDTVEDLTKEEETTDDSSDTSEATEEATE